MNGKVLKFPSKRAVSNVPGMTEAEDLVKRLGVTGAMRVAECILLECVFATRTPTKSGRVKPAPVLLTTHGIDLRTAVRSLGDLFELWEKQPKMFRRVERIFAADQKAEADAKKGSTP